MNALQNLLLTAIVLASTACASHSGKQHVALPVSETSSVANAMSPDPEAADGDPADLDVKAADEHDGVRDPWEGFNRKIHGFNNAADRLVLRPLAVGYNTITPAPVQAGVSRFFANLRIPVTAMNQALQGRPRHAAQSLGRLVVNTTVGIGGLFDPASSFGMARRHDEDFGQTLAIWGWRSSRFLVVPLLGPRTLRDAVAIAGDEPLSPIGQIQDNGTSNGLLLLQTVDGRAQMLPLDKFRREALDDYLFVRDAWAQRRSHQIRQGVDGE